MEIEPTTISKLSRFLIILFISILDVHDKCIFPLITEKEHPEDDDDPDFLISAISEDTPHIPYRPLKRTTEDILERSREYYNLMAKRRTVRNFSTEPIPQEVLENIVKTAGKLKHLKI